jgi:hypothetical protein
MLYIATNKQLVDNPCLARHQQNPAAYLTINGITVSFMTHARALKTMLTRLDLRDSITD